MNVLTRFNTVQFICTGTSSQNFIDELLLKIVEVGLPTSPVDFNDIEKLNHFKSELYHTLQLLN